MKSCWRKHCRANKKCRLGLIPAYNSKISGRLPLEVIKDIIYKVAIWIIALPFLLKLAFGSGTGFLKFFLVLWNKNVKMTAKDGVITSVIYV